VTWIHASAINIETKGFLIRGASGAGKSHLLLALLEEARQRGLFASMIGDDRIELFTDGSHLAARPHPLISGMVEDRPKGIVERPFLAASRIQMVIDINDATPLPRCDEIAPTLANICLEGINLPLLTLKRGAPLAETTAKVFSLIQSL
jgi:serine kinase of HPr protein (carbohydrate metabolism regulator)